MMAEWLFARDMKEMMGEITIDEPTKKSCHLLDKGCCQDASCLAREIDDKTLNTALLLARK